jgi:hypothetical protein
MYAVPCARQVRNATTKAEAVEASEAGIKALTDIMTQVHSQTINIDHTNMYR